MEGKPVARYDPWRLPDVVTSTILDQALDLRQLDREHPDGREVAGAVAVIQAARLADHPQRPVSTASGFAARTRYGWDGEPPLTAVSHDATGRVDGVLTLWLPRRDNTHLGMVYPIVDPVARRRGVGRAMFGAGVRILREQGRTVVVSAGLEGTAGPAFATAMGMDQVSVQVNREQDLTRLDRPALAQLLAEARGHAGDYEIIRVAGRTPAHLRVDVATISEAMNDAPVDGMDVEHEVFSPERVTAFDDAQLGCGRRVYRLIARHRASGAPAGQTVVGVEAEQPWYCWQYDTGVVRGHRGHRLGLVLKLSMLDWLAEVEPQVRVVHTDNAESNSPMVRINETLGYHIDSREIGFQLRL